MFNDIRIERNWISKINGRRRMIFIWHNSGMDRVWNIYGSWYGTRWIFIAKFSGCRLCCKLLSRGKNPHPSYRYKSLSNGSNASQALNWAEKVHIIHGIKIQFVSWSWPLTQNLGIKDDLGNPIGTIQKLNNTSPKFAIAKV